MKKTLAFISEHASPLAALGGVDSGGQNVYVAEVCKELAAKGYLVDVFTRKDAAALPEVYYWLPGVRIIHIKAGPQKFVAKEDLLGLMDEFAKRMIKFICDENIKYSLIHAHFFMSALVASEVKKVLNIPYVVTFHALGLVRKLHQQEADKFPAERICIEKNIVRDADAIVAECPQDKDDLMNLYNANEDKITVIPCGFSEKEFQPVDKQEARKKLNIDEKDFVLLQLGRMVPRKGVANVIKALGYLKSKYNHIKLLVVGGECEVHETCSNPEIKRLQRVAHDYNVEAQVIFTGRKNRQELKYYYSASDIFISTPWYEPFGITPLEAMACRLPVIGSHVGGIKYSVVNNETGFLVPPHQPKALSVKIAQLINNNNLRQQMAAKGLQRVHDYFTWEKVTESLSILYEDLIETKYNYQSLVLTHETNVVILEREFALKLRRS